MIQYSPFAKMIRLASLVLLLICASFIVSAQEEKDADTASIYGGLKFRSIGPALMSGRIADIAIHPENENIWYVAVASGGVWKTENSGTTWAPLFDGQASYSIGCVSLDPQNPDIVWVGTGENVGGRHMGYGDGIYRSEDGGKSWKNMGLKKSEHLSKIIIHPSNSDIIWVASQGPLWSKGGERGVYKTTDGGKTWNRTLGDEEWVGATDLLIDPRNPEVVYAATWQRHRTVAGYMGGGPGTAIYKSTDGGKTWDKLKNGLPSSNMGKIGLAISPQKPDVIYAAIELDRRKGGVYRSENQGASWTKMSEAVSGGTGPHYYQELYASPHNFDELYLANNYMLESFDGGKTFKQMNESQKHVDNHAVAFKKSDPNFILVGCDGGLYQSFDKTKNWKYIDNLPITQFYKIALDDAEPFYHVYGGTQDNNTQGAPTRTDNVHGIRNSDWFVVLGGDGHQPATVPGNPNIIYVQSQQGNLHRHDRLTGENTYIRPQPELGEKTERYNWDAPVLVSPHNSKTVYHASQRVWKSDDMGDTWTPISPDLTSQTERIQTPFYGQKQKWDNAWDIFAMSNYSTITSLSESPKQAGLLYAGTDDGIIQVTEDGGKNWRKVDYAKLKGLPKTAFVNDIKADLHDANVVYAVFDNHKYGDYQPYLYKSSDKGKTWTSLSNTLTDCTLLWRIVQDHVNPNLLFLGTEFGVYCSRDGGKEWVQLKGGLPNISVRDLAIQQRENDLVLATFGRGIYVLDDYSALRTVDAKKEAQLFAPRTGLWYKQRRDLSYTRKGSQGDNFFVADNPAYGVEFTYYLKEAYKSKEAQRKAKEKELEKKGEEVGVPEWKVLEEEMQELKPEVFLFIYDQEGNIIKRIQAKNSKGMQRINWDYSTDPMNTLHNVKGANGGNGPMVAPGTYTARLFKQVEGQFTALTEPVSFEVKALKNKLTNPAEKVAQYWREVTALGVQVDDLRHAVKKTEDQVQLLLIAYERAAETDTALHKQLLVLRDDILNLGQQFSGSDARNEVGEKNEYPTIYDYLGAARGNTTYGPTTEHMESFGKVQKLYEQHSEELKAIKAKLPAMYTKLERIGAPKVDR